MLQITIIEKRTQTTVPIAHLESEESRYHPSDYRHDDTRCSAASLGSNELMAE
ncbi:hypothetical protein AVEN_158414-1, partial [Araneus ventricosus]